MRLKKFVQHIIGKIKFEFYHFGGSGSSSLVNVGMISSPVSNLIGMILSLTEFDGSGKILIDGWFCVADVVGVGVPVVDVDVFGRSKSSSWV